MVHGKPWHDYIKLPLVTRDLRPYGPTLWPYPHSGATLVSHNPVCATDLRAICSTPSLHAFGSRELRPPSILVLGAPAPPQSLGTLFFPWMLVTVAPSWCPVLAVSLGPFGSPSGPWDPLTMAQSLSVVPWMLLAKSPSWLLPPSTPP